MKKDVNVDTLFGGAMKEEKKEGIASVEKKRRKMAVIDHSLEQHLKYAIPELRLALIRETKVEPRIVFCPEDLDFFVEPLKHYAEENFVSFHLNSRHEVIGHQIVSRGTVTSSLVHPREVFKAAIINNSYAIIVAHNHPGGSLIPSEEDKHTTTQLVKAGNLLGVPVVDHIIVASTGTYSLRDKNPRLWSQ